MFKQLHSSVMFLSQAKLRFRSVAGTVMVLLALQTFASTAEAVVELSGDTSASSLSLRVNAISGIRLNTLDDSDLSLDTDPEFVSPLPGSTLSTDTATFEWSDNGVSKHMWMVQLGTTPGSGNIYTGNYPGHVRGAFVSGLPTDGRTLFLRLSYQDKRGADIQYMDAIYTAPNLGNPEIYSPSSESKLKTNGEIFKWSANGRTVQKWKLFLGTHRGSKNVYSTTVAGNITELKITDLPRNKQKIYARLSWCTTVDGPWENRDFKFLLTSRE